MYVNFNILNQLGSPSLNSNTFANRPAAGQVGRLFISTDTLAIYRDNGTSWDQIGGGSGISGSGTAGQVTYWDGTSSVTGESAFTYNAVNNALELSGSIGLNNAPSSWSSARAFQSGTSSFAGSIVGNGYYLTTNTYYDGSNWKYITTGTASRLDVAGNEFIFGQAVSGSAGSNATFNTGLYLDSSNRLGVNAAPSAWQSVYKVVQLPFGASFYSNDSATTVGLTSNAYYNTGASWQRFFTGTSARYEMANNSHAWYIAASGTGAITYTQAMTLFTTGNLAIGTTTDNSRRLYVNGDTQLRGSTSNSSASALIVQNLSSNIINCVNTGLILFGAAASTPALFTFTTTTGVAGVNLSGTNFQFSSGTTNQSAIAGRLCFSGSTMTHTSGANKNLYIISSFAPTSGTSDFSDFQIDSTINQTGGANGISRGLYINPTLTAATNWRSLDIANNAHWALYQSGASAKNYFAGNTLIGTSTDSGFKLDVNGSSRMNGTVRIDGQTAVSAGGSAGLHLIVNCDGTNYKIALLNV